MNMVTKGFRAGAYMAKGSLAVLSNVKEDEFLPCHRPELARMKFFVTETFLAGDLVAVDVGYYDGFGPAPTLADGMEIRAVTEEELKQLQERGITT